MVDAVGELCLGVKVKVEPLEGIVALQFAVVVVNLGFGVLLYTVLAEMGQQQLDVELKVELVPL